MTAPQGKQHQPPGIRLTVNQIIAGVVLIVLLVFIFSNRQSMDVQFLAWGFRAPIWVAMLITAVVGAAIGAAAVAFVNRKRGKAKARAKV